MAEKGGPYTRRGLIRGILQYFFILSRSLVKRNQDLFVRANSDDCWTHTEEQSFFVCLQVSCRRQPCWADWWEMSVSSAEKSLPLGCDTKGLLDSDVMPEGCRKMESAPVGEILQKHAISEGLKIRSEKLRGKVRLSKGTLFKRYSWHSQGSVSLPLWHCWWQGKCIYVHVICLVS